MYRMLIVDDEAFITDGLYWLFKNNGELSFEVYRAYSAREALSILNKYRMDIVITDIMMAGLTGLDLTKEIKMRWADCRIIILSGYSEFDYACTAMDLGVDQYLLKSQGDEVLIDAVKKCISIIEKQHDEAQWKEQAEKALKKAQPLLCREFLFDLLSGNQKVQDQIDLSFRELEIPFSSEYPIFLIGGRLDKMAHPNVSLSTLSRQLTNIDTIFKEYVTSRAFSIQLSWNRRYMLWLIQSKNLPDTGVPDFPHFLSGMLERIQEHCRRQLGTYVSFLIEPNAVTWPDLPECYTKLCQILNQQLSVENKMALVSTAYFQEDDAKKEFNKNITASMKSLEQLRIFFEYRQKDKFYPLFREMLLKLLDYSQKEIQFVVYHNLCSILLDGIIAAGKLDQFTKHFHNLNLFSTPYEQWDTSLCEKFSSAADWLFAFEENENEQRVKQMIYVLHDYIAKHLNEDLSLTRLSETVYLNPVYLSRVYKQITGENISKYIADCRIKEAKSLLRQPEYKINEIAAAVGYESAAHFSRTFKKAVGISPQDYRA